MPRKRKRVALADEGEKTTAPVTKQNLKESAAKDGSQLENKKKHDAAALTNTAKAKPTKEKETESKRKKQKTEQNDKEQPALREIAGYTIVPIQLNTFAEGQRYLYCKEHASKGDDDPKATPSGRTLLVTNISVDMNEEILRQIFERIGKIVSITFKRLVTQTDSSEHARAENDGNQGQREIFAHLVFSSPKSIPKLVKFDWSPVNVTPSTENLGLEKWLEGYKGTRPDPTDIMAEVDAFMYDFDKKQAKAREELEKSFGKPDPDGFILVQRKGRKRLKDGAGVSVTATKVTPELIEKSQKKNTLDDFYRFQRRENMRKQLADLRIRFEDDKKRIAKMRAQRKFRPG